MRESEFWRLMDEEFGPQYSRTLAGDLVVGALGERTPLGALRVGLNPRRVWEAVCEAQDVPRQRWLGRDIAPRS